MNIVITRPKKEDIKELHILFKSAITDAFKKDGIDNNKEITEEVRKQLGFVSSDFESSGSDTFYLIAKTEEKIVGTIAYGKPSDLIKKYLKVNLRNVPEIISVYMLPQFQGKNIGSLLFNALLI